MTLTKHLILLSGPELSAQDRCLLKLADFMGVATKNVSLGGGGEYTTRTFDELGPESFSLAMSAETLEAIDRGPVSNAELQRLIDGCSPQLLIFGCSSKKQESAIGRLTAGAIRGVREARSSPTRFALPRKAAEFGRQLAGLSFVSRQAAASGFDVGNAMYGLDVIMTADELPMFVRVGRGSTQVFLLSGPLADINQPVSPDHKVEDCYQSLIPALIFLFQSFRDSCWRSTQTTARLIIDDPVLSERYGFLDYGSLAESMRRQHYGTSIAFIPWNYWRTSRQSAARLLLENENLAICIHGCDHTNREFDGYSTPLLARKAGLALRRMESLRKRTSAAFDPVMIFPQGRFSRAAIAALRASNFLAAVNSTCFATDGGGDDLKVGDFLRPAINHYEGFPIFQRRYPGSLFDFAFDLFLGKPALVVEHHEYFREGYRALEDFVAELQKMEPGLSWPDITAQLTRTCRKRHLGNGMVEVEFFTRRFQLVNREDSANSFLLRKREPDLATVESVLVDGVRTPFSFENDFLRLEIQADPGEMRNVEIVDRKQPHPQAGGFGLVHNTGVLIRRGLSEFRDNTLAQHGALLKAAKGIARALKVTGDA
jgi:hypothetical protein